MTFGWLFVGEVNDVHPLSFQEDDETTFPLQPGVVACPVPANVLQADFVDALSQAEWVSGARRLKVAYACQNADSVSVLWVAEITVFIHSFFYQVAMRRIASVELPLDYRKVLMFLLGAKRDFSPPLGGEAAVLRALRIVDTAVPPVGVGEMLKVVKAACLLTPRECALESLALANSAIRKAFDRELRCAMGLYDIEPIHRRRRKKVEESADETS